MGIWLWSAIVATAAVNAAAQLLMKKGAVVLDPALSGENAWYEKLVRIAANPYVLCAVALFAVGLYLWIKILARTDLSLAYPVNIALSIVITSAIGAVAFHEPMTVLKVFGTALIVAGLWSIVSG